MRSITDQRLILIRNAYQGLKERSIRSYAPQPVIDRAEEMVTLCDELISLRALVGGTHRLRATAASHH